MCFNKQKLLGTLLGLFLFSTTMLAATKLNVVAITPDFGSIAKSVGGDQVSVKVLLSQSQDLHDVYPKPSMVYTLKKADLVIRLGLGQDTWIDSLIEVARNRNLFLGQAGHLDASINIDVLEVPSGNVDGRYGDVHKEGNPHYWLDPNNAKIIAQQISDRLQTIDPKHASYYLKNTQSFIKQLDKKIFQWQSQLKSLQQVKIVTYHKNWSYFIKAFDLNLLAYIEPFPGVAPSPRYLNKLINQIKSENVPVHILMADYYSPKASEFIQKKTGSKLIIQAPYTRKNQTYIEFMDSLVQQLMHD